MKLSTYKPADSAPSTPWEKDADKSLDRIFAELKAMLNSGLGFVENFDCAIVNIVTNATPGVETAITHGLKRIPKGFLVLEKDKAAHLLVGQTTKTSTTYYVQSDVATVRATVMIF